MNNTQFTENGLYYRQWPTSQVIDSRTVLLVHGLGEHCERYGPLAAALNDAGYNVCSMDLPGHGKSEGTRGHIDSFKDYHQAVLGLRAKIDDWYPNRKVFLLGHSMGGLISTQLLLDHQDLFAGALLSGAAIQSPQAPPSWQISLIKLISKVAPKAGMLELDASKISRDPEVVKTYMNDPLVNKGKLSAKFLVAMFAAMNECQTRASAINLPIRIMHGSDDVMTASAGSELLYNKVSSTDKELKIYDGLFHEIFNEPEAPEIYTEIIDWLDKRS